MSSLIDEQQVWPDSSGAPIVNGFIHIGVANQDPTLLANKITIYSERDLLTPISNPQRTDANGRSVNKIWVPSKYSITVQDSDSTQKYSELDAGESPATGISNLTNIAGANTITADASPTISALVDKEIYVFTSIGTNTGAVTLAIDLVAAKSVLKFHDQDLVAGDIEINQVVSVMYNGTDDTLELLSGTAAANFPIPVAIGKDIIFDELADHESTPAAGKGILWLKDDTPSSLMFTDDAGTDFHVSSPLATKVIDIGDWNMDSTAILEVAHGLTLANIRNISALIRNDTDDRYWDFAATRDASETGSNTINADVDTVDFIRAASGIFDSTAFDSTSFNRGWITIQYVA